jgi:ABC-type multidrug transport system ATPase subunit
MVDLEAQTQQDTEADLAARIDGRLATKPGATKPEAPVGGATGVEAAIRMTSVTRMFGMKNAVDDLTLVVPRGSVFGLIGPNGAGKTTTFSMLSGYMRPSKGTIEVLGFAPGRVDDLRGRIGVLPQDALLPASDRVGDFLVDMGRLQGMGPADAIKRARDALEEVEGSDWWGSRCGALSHGMAKRVALAQAFLGDPELVLLDEPTAGLDPRIAYGVRQILKGRRGRCTLVVSSHNLTELEEVCDSAAILDRGRLVASGAMGELTAATEEVHFRVPPLRRAPDPAQAPGASPAPSPLDEVRALPMVRVAEYDDERGELVVHFDRTQQGVDAEIVIGAVLWVLLQHRVRISAVSKGRGLEQRVMDLTRGS